MQLKLYNTLTHSIQEFTPIDPNNVKIYSCGPTVYAEPHVGNMRKYFLDDLLKNVIKNILGFPTTHVVNITDVGHLTGENEGDADHGEDKMEKGARREGITARDVAKKYEGIFHQVCEQLKLDKFDVTPRATDHIQEQIDMVVELEKKGFTYRIEGDGIYMDTSKVQDYDCLVGHKHIEGLQAGARIDNAGRKNPTDFALRKFNISGKKRDMERDSPWGVGFPGRHIECSAMSIKYLGMHFDIHTGGIDHIPVHHTNEIAQSQCSIAETPWVNYRVHYQFLNVLGQRIGKSNGNSITLQEVLDKGYTAEDLRYFYLQAHYKSFQDFTWEALDAAKAARSGLKKKINNIMREFDIETENTLGYKEFRATMTNDYVDEKIRITVEALLNDLNTPELLGKINTVLGKKGHIVQHYKNEFEKLSYLDRYILKLGLFETNDNQIILNIPEEVRQLAEQRLAAKQEKNRALADELRKQIEEVGYSIVDNAQGYELQPK